MSLSLLLVLLMALFAAPALAHVGGHSLSTTFSGSGSDALSDPTAVAVDNSHSESAGDVYVTDPADHRIEKFDEAGNFILMFGKSVNMGAGNPDVCTNAGPPTDTCVPGTPGASPGDLSRPTYVAVDDSEGQSSGDIYIGDTEDGTVSKFDSNGNLVGGWGDSGQLSGFSPISGIAVGPSGDLFVQSSSTTFRYDESGNFKSEFGSANYTTSAGLAVDAEEHLYKVAYEGEVIKFANTGESLGVPDGDPGSEHPAFGVTVDPTSNDLYVVQGSYALTNGAYVIHFLLNRIALNCGSDCAPVESFGGGDLMNTPSAQNIYRGLAISRTTNRVYVANTGGGDVVTFAPIYTPDVNLRSASDPTHNSVTLNGNIDPAGGGPVTSCHFDYSSADLSYNLGSVPCSPTGPFTSPTSVEATVPNLTAATTYHYRLVAANANGSTVGPDATFLLEPDLPTIDATSSSSVGRTTAVLGAEIDPGFGPTVYRFRWGTDSSYEFSTPFSDTSVGADGVPRAVTAAISDLSPATTYHFQVDAVNFSGVTEGPDRVFSTTDVPQIVNSSASSESPTTATITIAFKPGYDATTYHIDYGPSNDYGLTTKGSPATTVDDAVHIASVDLAGLTPATTYHYQVVASNATGTTLGSDLTFTTAAGQMLSGHSSPARKCSARKNKKLVKCARKRKHKQPSHGKRSHHG